MHTNISKDDDNLEEAEKNDEDDISCNNSNVVTPNQDNSIKV